MLREHAPELLKNRRLLLPMSLSSVGLSEFVRSSSGQSVATHQTYADDGFQICLGMERLKQ
jgi:hypothetical protein